MEYLCWKMNSFFPFFSEVHRSFFLEQNFEALCPVPCAWQHNQLHTWSETDCLADTDSAKSLLLRTEERYNLCPVYWWKWVFLPCLHNNKRERSLPDLVCVHDTIQPLSLWLANGTCTALNPQQWCVKTGPHTGTTKNKKLYFLFSYLLHMVLNVPTPS